jgi:hypothetical protein
MSNKKTGKKYKRVKDVEIFQDMIDRLVKVQTIEEAKHILMAESYDKSVVPTSQASRSTYNNSAQPLE